MRAENLTLENSSREVNLFGLQFIWWHRLLWSDGFYQPPYFEVRTPNYRGFIWRMGRYHPWGPTTEIPNGGQTNV